MERIGNETFPPLQQIHSSERSIDTKGLSRIRDHKGLMNSLAKDAVESWPGRSPRLHRGKSLSHHGSPVVTTALTHIYSPPSQPIPLSSEGIVVQALNVVSDQASNCFFSNAERNLKKISKRRKKANGGVDVEHTKSNNELLRKLQHALRNDSQEDSEEDIQRRQNKVVSSDQIIPPRMETFWRNTPQWTIEGTKQIQADEESITSKTTISTIASDTTNRSFSYRTNTKRDENSDAQQSHFYEYEDPEKVMAPIHVRRVPGMARRRGSVTEHTIRAAQKAVALDAAERAQRMNWSRSCPDMKLDSAATVAAAAERLQNIHKLGGRSRNALFERPESASAKLLSKKVERPLPDIRIAADELRAGFAGPGDTSMESRNGQLSSWDNKRALPSHPYGYEAMGMSDHSASAGNESQENPYGYEYPADRCTQFRKNNIRSKAPDTSTSHSNPYGYGDLPPQAQPRIRPRARRRGSVTKYSLEAAKISAAREGPGEEDFQSSADYEPVLPSGILPREGSLSPKSGFRAPEQPMRKTSPWQSHSSPFVARKYALARKSKTVGPPLVHISSRRDSFRAKLNRNTPNDSSEEDDNRSISSGSSDGSVDDSATSITIPLKSGDPKQDRPMRPPSRHDSLRSFASRGSSHSVRTFDSSDGDSLAPDMISLCSISQREQRMVGPETSDSVPPPPLFLPQTPTPGVHNRKFQSSNMHSRQTQINSNGDTVPALAFDDASPLPSPTTHVHACCVGNPAFQGEMVFHPELPNSTVKAATNADAIDSH